MKYQRITLQDIAELANVTKMTVSRYLRTPEKVAPETAARIASILSEVNFIADPDNVGHSAASIKRIGVLVPSFNNQIFADLLAGIESVAGARHIQTLVMNYDYDLLREEQQIAAILNQRISGLILTESQHSLRANKYLNSAHLPVAEVMGTQPGAGRINVGFDNRLAGYEMTKIILARGKKNIIWFGAMDDMRDRLRYEGYCQAMAESGRPAGRILPNKISSVSIASDMLAQALIDYPAIDAAFCTNDDIAAGVLQACRQRQWSVPGKMAIAGFHGLAIGQVTSPVLASVITPRFEMGRMATRIVISQIEGTPAQHHINLPFRLFVGESI